MSRPKGIIENKPRRPRKDIGKKRKNYKGKPCKHKNRKEYYKRKTGTKEDLWIWLWYKKPMSRDGYYNWNINVRPKIHKEVVMINLTRPMRVPFDQINTREKIENFVACNTWEGKWLVMGGSHGKNKRHFKPVKICTIIVKQTNEGNIGKIIESPRLHKYKWFMRN